MPRPYDDFPPLEMPDFSTPAPIAGGGLRALRSPRLESPFETLDRLEREKREVEAAQARLARLRGEPGPAANPPPVPTQRRAAETPSSWQIPTGLPEPIQYPQSVQPAQPATSVGAPRSENPAPLSTEGAGNAAQAFGRGVERNLGEAVGGAAGAWVGAKAGGAAGAAIGTAIAPGIGTGIGGLIGLVGGSIAGMFGGGWLGKQAQKAVMGEEAWQRAEEQYQRDLAAHPLAALGGSLAPHAATLLVPGGAAKAAKAGRAGTVAWMEAGRAGQVSEEALRAARAAEAAAREAQAAQRHIRMTRGAVEALNRTGAARTDVGARVVESLSGRVKAYVTAAEKESEMLKAARAAGAPIVGRVGQARAAKALRAGRFAYMGQAMTDYFADGEYNAYAPEVYATTGDRLLSDAEVAWEAAQKGGKGFWNQLIGERLSDPDKLVGSIPFLGSWHNAAKQRDIEERRRRLADPARSYGVDYYANPQYLRDRERVIADENARRIDAAREQSIRGIAGQIIGDMPAFMVEIANTPELGNLGAARGALAKVGGGMLQAAIQSNFQPGAVAAGYERNRGNEWTITEDEWGALRLAVERAGDSETKALWKGWAQNAVEYVSETMGEYMQAGVAAGGRRLMKATKPMPQKLGRFLADVFGDTPAIGRVRGTLRAGAVQPFFESLEERAGDFLKAAILADDREEGENYWQHLFQSLNPGWRQWLAEQLAFLPLGGVQIAGALGERRRMEREDRGRGTPAGTPPAPDGGAPEGTEDIPDEALVTRRDRLAEFLRQRGAPEETVNAVATATDASQINDAMNAMVADAAMRALRPRLSEEQWGRLQGFRDPRQRLAQAARLVGRYSEMDNALLAASAALENEDAPEDLVQRTVSMLTSLKPEWRELAEGAESPREALMEIAAQANAELADGKLDPAAPVWKDVTARDLAARLHGAEAAAEDSRIADLAVEALVEALPEAERAEYDGLATAGERSQWLDRRLRDPNAALNSVLAIGRHIARPDIDAPGAMLAATLDQLKGHFGGAWALAGGDEARGTPKERLAALVAEIDKDEANKRFLDAFAADNGATDSLDGAFEEMPSIVDADLRPPEEGGMAEAEALAPIPGEGAAPAPVEAPAPVAPPPGMPLDATESAPAPAPANEPSAPAPAPQEATEAPETPPAEESTELPPAEERYTREQLEALDADTLRGMVRATGLPTGGLSKTPLINILMHIQDEALTWEPPEITAEQRGKSTAILSKWLHDGDTILFADGSRGTVSKDGAFGAATIRTDKHGDVSLDEDRKLRVLAVYRGEAEVTQDLHVTSRGNAPDTAQEQKARADRIAKRLPGVRVAVVAAGAKGIPPRIAAKFRANPDGKAMFDEDTATIYLGTQSDLSSLPHEVFHAILHWSRTKARGLHGQLSKLLANPPASALEWAKRHYPGATADALREEACAELWGRALAEEIAGEERREADRLADALAESEMPWWDKVRELCARILEKFVAHVPETSRGRSNDGAPIDLGTLSKLSPEQAARRLYDAIFAGTGIDWQGREWTDEELPRRAEDAEREAEPAPNREPAPILSGDEVRKTMPGYDPANWRTHVDRTGYVGPRMEARFQELLKTRKGKGNGEVVFLAGGNGVGKSTVAGNLGETPDFIIDSTLGNLSVARKQIDAILANGQKPVVFFVYRTPEQALDAIQGRVENGGHAVSPLSFADSHTKSLENLRLLSDEYGDKVEIHIVDNSVEGAPEITIEQLEAKGKPNHAAIRKRANEVLGRYQGALGGDVGAQSPDQGGGGSTGEEGGGRPEGTRRPRNAPAAPAGLETPPAGGTPAQEDLSAKTADEVRAIAKGLGIKTGGKPKSRLIAEIQAKTAPKTAKPGDEFANRILDAIETDARDGLIAVFADNRFGDGAYVANYADGSREEVERAADGIRRAFPDMEVLASDTGLVVKPKKEAAAATQRKPAAESPMDRAKAAAEKHVVTYGQGLKATLAQMIEKGDARLYPDKGLLTFDKGKPHVVTFGFEQFTPTKAELPYLVRLQKDYDAAHPNELPPSQRGQTASPATANGKTDLEQAQDHLNALREELRQHEEAQRGVAYAFTEDGRKARKDAEDYTARLEADIADAERRVAELGGTVEKEKAAPPTPKELANKSTAQLHRLAKENGLPTAGTRTELLMRLAAHFGQQARALQQGAESGNVEINQQGAEDEPSVRQDTSEGQRAGPGSQDGLDRNEGYQSEAGAGAVEQARTPAVPVDEREPDSGIGQGIDGTGGAEVRGVRAGQGVGAGGRELAGGRESAGERQVVGGGDAYLPASGGIAGGRRGGEPSGGSADNLGEPGGRGSGGISEPGAGVGVGGGSGSRGVGPRPVGGEAQTADGEGVRGARARPRNADNHVITDPDFLDAGGAKAKFRDNLAALRVLKTLREEGREATPEEREIIAKYVGWGRSEFRNGLFGWYGGEWQKERDELKEVIGEEEFESARKSTLTAFWTPPRMAQAVWSALDRLGFKGGRIHEPSIGTGIFFGTMPTDVRDRSVLSGADKDVLASEIARALYPGARITNGAYQEENLPDDFYDLVVGNFPFADFTIRRDKYNRVSANLHDYFWLKSLGIVRPGGLVAAITSTGTMDKANDAVRREIAGKADVVAAIRLPEGTFSGVAGTEVVTDLIILRKREPGTEMSADTRAWLETVPYSDLAKGDEYLPGEVNQYYKLHPDHIVGTPTGRSGRFGQTTTIKLGPEESAGDRIDAILAGLPENVYSPRVRKVEAPKTASAAELGIDATALRDGSLVAKDGEIWENTTQGLVQVKAPQNQKRKARFLIGLRDTLNALRAAETTDGSDSQLNALRKELNRRYDAFVKEYGPLSKQGMLGIMDGDPSSHMLLALERSYDKEKNKAVKADIFTTRVGYAKSRATHADNYEQAAGFSMNETGHLDAVRVGEMMGVDTATAERELFGKGLAYRAPDGQIVGADEYLSGNVREKLSQAEAAARLDPAFTPNVEALRKVLPADKAPGDITVNLGATWVPADVMSAFASHVLGVPAGEKGIEFEYNHALGRWLVALPADRYAAGLVTRSTAYNNTYATKHRSFTDILDAALHDQRIRITRRDPYTGETEFLAVESEEANTKADKLKNEFLAWVWQDKDRAARLSRIYNDTFNGFVERKRGGRWLTFPGITPSIKPRQHQVAAVEKLLACRRLLMAHEVGTGKTITYGLMARKAKETGSASKPLLVVKNSTIKQVASEIQGLFPDMNIFVGGESMTSTRRKRSMAQIANNNWDLVILTHDNLGSLDSDPAVEQKFIDGQIMELRAAADAAAANPALSKRERDRIRKNLLKRIESLNERLKALLKAPKTDGVATFQDLGFDMVMVDECQAFKKLPIATYRTRVKGIPAEGSKRASNLLMNIQNLLDNNPEACVVFGSGTPLDNSLVEAYVWQRYLQNDLLRNAGITSFDAWASNFGRTTADIEMSPSGGDWKEVERFKEFVNLGELSSMMRQNMDVVFARDTGEIVRPTRHDSENVSPETDISREVTADLEARAKAIKERHGKPEKGQDNMLVVSGDGRKAAVHPGLYKPEYVNAKGTKAEACIKRVAQNHKADPKAAQMIFCDCGVNDTPWGFNLYRFLRDGLVKAGFKPSQVAFFSTNLSPAGRAALAKKMNSGEVLVAIGSTDTMGTGVNAQKRLRWMHHLDASRMMTPGSIEQRNGRGHRQGNTYKDVEVVYYTQERSLDAFTWNLIKNKAGFINAFMRGEDLGTIEEESDTVSYDQLVANASGDVRVIKKAQIEKQLHRLRLQEAAFEQSQRDQAADKRSSEWQLKHLDGEIKALESAVDVAASTVGQPFSVEVVKSGIHPSSTHTERDAALSSALDAAVDATATRLKESEWRLASGRATVAKYRGFDIQIGWEKPARASEAPRLRYFLELPDGSRTAYYLSPNFDRDDKQTQMLAVFRSADAIIGGLKHKLQGAVEERANTARRIEELSAGLDRKFENAEKITSLQIELQQLNDALSGKDKEKKEGDRVENPEESATKFQRGAPARDWSTATIPEMRKELVRRGLSPSGSAAALRRRLEEDARQDGEGGGVRWQKAAPMLARQLDRRPKVRVYRAMQMVDGKLYPPMAAKVGGKWVDPTEPGTWYVADEHPELAIPVIDKRTGKQKVDRETGRPVFAFKLDKGNSSSITAAYNPYWHTSRTPLNDQFSSASKRPELVIVECEVPASELSSGYRADKAKDTVGEKDWHSGPVSSWLAEQGQRRKVILSRYSKVVRVVPDAEVAAEVRRMLDGTDISVPEGVVTPALRAELERLGVDISRQARSAYSWDKLAKDGKKPRTMAVPRFTRGAFAANATPKDMVAAAKESVRRAGGRDIPGRGLVINIPAFGDVVVVGKSGVLHGLRPYDAPYGKLDKADNADILSAAGEILRSSIPVNELRSRDGKTDGATLLLGAAADESGDIVPVVSVVNHVRDTNEIPPVRLYPLYSLNAKSRNPALSLLTATAEDSGQSVINIADLVEQIKDDVRIFSKDVYDHFKQERPAGEFSRLRFQRGGLYTGSAADYAHRRPDGSIVNGPSLHKVGSGEGAQVYGWGLYASDQRGVAEGYARSDKPELLVDGKPLNRPGEGTQATGNLVHLADTWNGDFDAIQRYLRENPADSEYWAGALELIEKHGVDHLSFGYAPGNIYEQTFFTNRATPEETERHLLKWYEPISEEQKQWIVDAFAKEGKVDFYLDGTPYQRGLVFRLEDIVPGRTKGGELYKMLVTEFGSPQAASEFLARADIDGIKYPVDSYGGKTVKEGDVAGWNYVSFRDDNIRVDHKWADGRQLFQKGGMLASLRYEMEDNGSEPSVDSLLDEWDKASAEGLTRKQWPLIPADQYRNALRRFMRDGDHFVFPERILRGWLRLCTKNLMEMYVITGMAGHDSWDATPEIEEHYDGDAGKFDLDAFLDWARLPEGSTSVSDYGLAPIYGILDELDENATSGQMIVALNRILDVMHMNGDLSAAFIEGGSKTLSRISNDRTPLFQRGAPIAPLRDWSSAKIPELRRELVARGLSPAGGADRLRQRLADDDAQRQGTVGASSVDVPDRSGQERPEGDFSNVRFQRGGTPPPIANPWDRAQVEYPDKSSTWRVVLREETEEEGKRKVKTTVLGRYATREAAEFALRQEQAVLSAASEALGKLPKARLAEIAEARRQLVDVMRRADATKEERADAIAAIGRTLGLHKDLIAKEWALAERILRTHDPESTMDAAEKAVRAVNTVLARASIRLHGRDMMRLVKQKAAGQVTGGLRKNKLLPVVEAWTLIRKQMTEAEKAAKLDEMDRAIDTLDAELSTGEGRPLTAAEENAKRRELTEKKHARELFAVFGGLASLHGGQNRARLAEDARAWAAASKALASLSDKAVQELEAKLTARAEDAKQKREGIIHDLTGGKDIPASNQEREDAKNARGWFERAREIVRGLVSASMGGGTAWGEVLTRDKSVAFGEGAASHLFHDGLDAGYRKEMEANMADKREGLRILAQFFDIDIDLEKPDELVKVIDFSEKCSSLFNEEAVDQDGNHEITVRSVRVTGAGKDRQVHVTASGPCTLKLGELMHFYLVGLQAEAAAGQAYTDTPKHTKGADCSLMEALVRHGYSAETMMEIRTALAKRGLDKLAMQISADMEKKGDALDALMASEYNSQLKRVHPYAPLRRLHWGLNEQGDAGGGGVGSFMSMVRSFMKERVANLRDFQTVNLIESWQSHNRQANHIIHLHDWISTVGRVMRHADMQTALDFVVGDRTRRALNAWLDIQARGGSMVIRDDDRMTQLARNFAVAVTTNPRIALKQLTSPGMALGMLPPGASTIEWFKDMARIAFPCEERRAFLAFLDGNSPEWRERGLNASDALSLINRHKAGSKYELLRLRVQRRLGAMTRWGDRNGALLGCYGVFRAWERKFLDEGMEAGAAKIAALEKFDESVNAGQQSVLPEYMSQVQTMGGLYKYMTMFHTAQIAMTRNLYIHAKAWAEGRGNRREHERAIVGVVTSAWAFRLMGMGMLPLAQIILGILQGDPDKFKTGATKTLQEGVLSLVEAPASGVMPWGDAIVGLADRFVKGGSGWGRTGSADIVPQLSVLANVDRIVADFSKKADKRDWLAVARHASDFIGQTTGYPVTPVVDAVSGTYDAWTASDLAPEQRVVRQLTFSRSAIGAPRRAPSGTPREPQRGGDMKMHN